MTTTARGSVTRQRWRRCAAALVAAVAGVGLAACSSSDGSQGSQGGGSGLQTIKVGYIPDMGGSAIAVANKLGLWAKAGLKADEKSFTSGPTEVEAMAGGDIDVGYIGPGAAWLPASGRATVIAVDNIGLGDEVIVHPGHGISRLADLKGKTIGVPEGTSGDMILRLALAKAGLSIDDVKIANMDPPTTVAAFSSNRIDAAGIWVPLASQMASKVPGSTVLASDKDFYPQHVFPGLWLAKPGMTSSHAELVKKFLWVYQQAATYRAQHVKPTIELASKLDGVPADQLGQQADATKYQTATELGADVSSGRVATWLSGLEELFVTMGKLKSANPPSKFFDSELFTQALSYRPNQ